MKPGVPDTVPKTPVARKDMSGGRTLGKREFGEVRECTLIVTFEDEGGGGEDVEGDEQCLSRHPPPYVETHGE
jgi:hypothetical protein